MSELIEQFKAKAGKHFVTLSCVQTLLDGSEKAHIFSGFIAEIAGAWIYVTAGHLLTRLDEALGTGSTFDIWRLGDQTAAGGRFQHTAVPFEFVRTEWLVVANEQTGLDYGVVSLHDHFRRQLEAGGVVALDQTAWADPTPAPDSQWALMGVPSESVSYDGATMLNARFVVVRVIPAAEPPSARAQATNQVYASLIEGSEAVVSDADGLSGGPVFAVRKQGGRWTYAVIGVQSAWYRQSRLVAFCPWTIFANELEQEIELAKKALANGSRGLP